MASGERAADGAGAAWPEPGRRRFRGQIATGHRRADGVGPWHVRHFGATTMSDHNATKQDMTRKNHTRRMARFAWLRGFYLVLGLAFVGLGIAGAFLPVLPTTPFMILAAACFARSSTRLENWLLGHSRFGPLLRDWRARGAIPRRAKFASLLGTMAGYALFWLGASPGPLLAVAVAGLMLVGLAYVFSRPS